MATNMITLLVEGKQIDVLADSDLDFRLNRFVQDSRNFQIKGGDYSTTLELPFTKQNSRVFNLSASINSINKFNRTIPYAFELQFNGVKLIDGTLLINQISKSSIEVELYGNSIDWLASLEEIQLNRLGFVNELPTWFGINRLGQLFEGGKTINIVNELTNRDTDYVCPVILRYNTPVTDYLSENEGDMFGLYDSGGNQVLSPKDYPDSFRTVRGFFGTRLGLTFEDFPPCLYYRNVIEKCFEEIGYNINCPLFNEEWFNQLIMTYQGEDFYKYNWATLAELKLFVNVTNSINDFYFNIITKAPAEPVLDYTDTNFTMIAYPFNLAAGDDYLNRTDRIANFKKFLVTDDDYGYVVPATGKYKITMNSKYTRGMTDRGGELINLATLFGSGNPNYGWDDNMFMIVRSNQAGENILSPNYIGQAMNFMNGSFPEFTQTPTDVVAYVSPKRCALLGNNNIQASGSPLTNFQQQVDINYTNHTIDVFSLVEFKSTSEANFSIEVDLLQNERLNFVCLGVIDYATATPLVNGAVNMIYMARDGSVTHFEVIVEYLCGNEDISLADNLPEMSCKDFIKSFVNTFNLRFFTQDNTINFIPESQFFNQDLPYDITGRVIDRSIRFTPTKVSKNLVIGYDNDKDNFELNTVVEECVENVNQLSNYGNRVFFSNNNIYSEGDLSLKNMFSSTKFFEGDFSDCTDFNTITKNLVTITHPITGQIITKGATFGTIKNLAMFRLPIPSLQSITSVNEKVVGDLNYEFNQPIRLLQFLGTTNNIEYTPASRIEDYRFKIDSPDYERILEQDFWIRPTICSFNFEYPYYTPYAISENTTTPSQSMRYDVQNGLYDRFFTDIVELQNKSEIMECNAYLTSKDWNNMQANRVIKFNDALYRLLEISDYDVINADSCKIKMLRLL